jgi:hypothetical protein
MGEQGLTINERKQASNENQPEPTKTKQVKRKIEITM